MTRELSINILRSSRKHILIIHLGNGQLRNDGFKSPRLREATLGHRTATLPIIRSNPSLGSGGR